MGLLSVMGLIVALYCFQYSTRAVLKGDMNQPLGHRVMTAMLPCSLAVVILIFVFTVQNTYAELYFLPYTVWFIPMLSLAATDAPDYAVCPEIKPVLPGWLTGKKLVVYALCGVCILNGLSNMQSFANVQGFNQRYEALKMNRPEYASYLEGVVDYLVEQGYDMGYSEFWDTHVITEMSDGKLPTVNVYEVLGDYRYYDWLSLKSNRTTQMNKPFLLIKHDRLSVIEGKEIETVLRKATQIGAYVIYDITDLEVWREYLSR